MKHRIRRLFEEALPFNHFLGIRVVDVGDGFVHLELPFRPEFVGDPLRPALHGGVLSTLIDTAGGAATFTKLSPSAVVSTIDLRVDYLLPAAPELIAAEAHVVRVGNRVCVIDARLYHPSAPGHTVATGKGVYNVHRK